MAKKSNSALQGAPIDQYRKQIGKQNYKVNKRDLKASKRAADNRRSGLPFKVDTVLTLSAGLLVVMGVCFVLYWFLYQGPQQHSDPDDTL